MTGNKTEQTGTFKAIRVTPEVQKLMAEATKIIMVKTKGEVSTINGALEYILKDIIGEKDVR